MVMKRFKPLTANELSVLEACERGVNDIEAYQMGYPHVQRYKPDTIVAKTAEFFEKPRIVYYRSRPLPVRNDLPILTGTGRPSGYLPEYTALCYKYFNRPAQEVIKTTDERTGETTVETVTNNLPTKAGFACEIGVPSHRLHAWAAKLDSNGHVQYPEFAEAWRQAADAQQNILVQNTLNGKYNAGFAKFVAQNLLDWRESRDLTVVGDVNKPIVTINVNMSKEEAAQIYLDEMKNEKPIN